MRDVSEVSDKTAITHGVGSGGTERGDVGRYIWEADWEGPMEERSEPGRRSGSGGGLCGETVRAY